MKMREQDMGVGSCTFFSYHSFLFYLFSNFVRLGHVDPLPPTRKTWINSEEEIPVTPLATEVGKIDVAYKCFLCIEEKRKSGTAMEDSCQLSARLRKI